MFRDLFISSTITILAKAIKARPESKLAKVLLNEKLKKTIKDVAEYYAMLEMIAEEEEDES